MAASTRQSRDLTDEELKALGLVPLNPPEDPEPGPFAEMLTMGERLTLLALGAGTAVSLGVLVWWLA